MTIWDLLVVTCFLIPIFASMQAASTAGAHIGGYAASLIVGLLIGASFAFSMWSLHMKLVKRLQAGSNATLAVILV